MSQHSFRRFSDDSLIVVPCKIGRDPLALALDTGASHTTIDLTPLLMAGYEMKDAVRSAQIETASGIIDTQVFLVREFSSLGIIKRDFEVCAYDFFTYHLLTDFDGVLGLDFFADTQFCIDLKKGIITIQK